MIAGYGQVYGVERTRGVVATVQGAVSKTFLLAAILSFTALYAYKYVGTPQFPVILLPVSLIVGLIVMMVTMFKPTAAPVTAPLYAACEGVILGVISRYYDIAFAHKYPGGIALQAVILTGGTLFVMLFVYATRLVRVNDKLRAGIIIATGALGLFYLVTMILRLFHVQMPLVWSTSPLGIGFSVLVVGLAALNLLLDFDFIEGAAYAGAPKFMEWYGAFGLMLTLIWLYVEILVLLAKLAMSQQEE
jgi:uncharacterized YccA/Bax inhibitor family protein